MNYLILLLSINLWSLNALPSDAENTSLLTASTEIAVTVYTTSVAEIGTLVLLNKPIPCWSAGRQKDNYEYVNCATCEIRVGYQQQGPLGECTPSSGGGPVTDF
jgi:hypothetical protein